MTSEARQQPSQVGDLAGLADLILQYGAACRREGASLVIGELKPADLAAATDATLKRILRRVQRLEALADMAGIEPSDVRGALVGTWRN